MKVVIQRVKRAKVIVSNTIVGEIDAGMLILLGIEVNDNSDDVKWLTSKIGGLRIFNDEQEKMNLSLTDINGGALVVSQFTLHAQTKKGNRPSYIRSAHPDKAIPLYNMFIELLEEVVEPVRTGTFGAMMDVELVNDGPVTIIIDSKNKE